MRHDTHRRGMAQGQWAVADGGRWHAGEGGEHLGHAWRVVRMAARMCRALCGVSPRAWSPTLPATRRGTSTWERWQCQVPHTLGSARASRLLVCEESQGGGGVRRAGAGAARSKSKGSNRAVVEAGTCRFEKDASQCRSTTNNDACVSASCADTAVASPGSKSANRLCTYAWPASRAAVKPAVSKTTARSASSRRRVITGPLGGDPRPGRRREDSAVVAGAWRRADAAGADAGAAARRRGGMVRGVSAPGRMNTGEKGGRGSKNGPT
jgi:hypothetical protein